MSVHIAGLLRRRVLGALATGAVATTIAAVPAAHFNPGLTFRISASTKVYAGDTPPGQDNEVMRGRGVAVDGRSRIEFLVYTPTPSDLTTDDFLIGLDSGKAEVLHTATGNYSPANDMFGGPAVVALNRVMGGGGRGRFGGGPPRGGGGFRGGRGGGGRPGRAGGRGAGLSSGGFLDQLQLLNVTFKVEKLGAETVEKQQAQHYRITSDYNVHWGDQVFPGHAVTEIWTAALAGGAKIPNPFEPLIVADQSTDGPLIEYALKLRAVRSQLDGVPIKAVTTTTFTGVHDVVGFQAFLGDDPKVDKLTVVQETQITNIAPGDVDPKLVAVPDGPAEP